jgi:hypothetical protein
MRRLICALLIGLICAAVVTANTPTARMRLGRIWYGTDYDGAGGWNSKIQYPAAIAHDIDETSLHRGWIAHARKDGSYLMLTDWTDPAEAFFSHVCSYMFRVMNYTYPTQYDSNDFSYVFPMGSWRYQRWPSPKLSVDGERLYTEADTTSLPFLKLPNDKGDGPMPVVHIGERRVSENPDPYPPYPRRQLGERLVGERVIHETWRYVPGVRADRVTYGFAYGSPHQDYVITDITLTNDGIIGDPERDPDTVLERPQILRNVVWSYAYDVQQVYANGLNATQIGADTRAEYIQPAPGSDYAAALSWDGDDPDTPGPDYGDVSSDIQYRDLMIGNCFTLVGPLFVSEDPGTEYNTRLANQPLARNVTPEFGFDLTGQSYSPHTMEMQRLHATGGKWHMPLDTEIGDHEPTSAISGSHRGPTLIQTYGPSTGELSPDTFAENGWTLAPGDSVRIVMVVAAGGIDLEQSRRIGKRWNSLRAAGEPADSLMSADDAALYHTGRDTVIKAFNMAYWNWHGEFAPGVTRDDLARWGVEEMAPSKPMRYRQPYNVPDPPRPPEQVSVRGIRAARASGRLLGAELLGDHGIEIRFTMESEGDPDDADTGVPDFAGYRILRKEGSRNAAWTTVKQGAASTFTRIRRIEDFPACRSFIDTTATPGEQFWYAVVAYDDGTQNWARPGASLESSRWWTYTGMQPGGVVGETPPPRSLDSVRVVHDPYSLSMNRASTDILSESAEIVFSGLPDAAIISIFTESGRFVTMFPHRGYDSSIWDGLDQKHRLVTPGTYLLVVRSPFFGMTVRRFTVVP